MNVKKVIPLLALFSLFALPVSAQTFGPVADLFGNIQELIGSGLDGISANPAIWMKIIFIILIFIVLYNLAFAAFMKTANKGSKIMFSLIIAIAMIAPIPNELIEAIFLKLALVGVIIAILPVFGIWYFVRSLTHGQTVGRGTYAFAFIIWLLTLTFYINGIAVQVDIESIKAASAYLSLFAFGCLFYYGYKVIAGESSAGAIASNVGNAASSAQNSGWIPGTQAWDGAKKTHQLDDIQKKITILDSALKRVQGDIGDWTHLDAIQLARKSTLVRNDLVTISNAIQALLTEKQLKQVLHAGVLTNLEDDLKTIETEANALSSYDYRTLFVTHPEKVRDAVRPITVFFGPGKNLDKVLANYKKALGFA